MPGRRTFRGTSQRRRTGWEEGPGTQNILNIATNTVAILGNTQAATEDGNTVVRIRGYVELVLNQVSTTLDGFRGAIGIGIASVPAIAIGVTAVPTPVTEIEWEGWLWHQFFSLHGVVPSVTVERRLAFQIDSKAMRKIDTEEAIYAVIEATETGAANMSVVLGTRLLLKLA